MTGTGNDLNHDLWNDSFSGQYLWSDTNFGEAVTEVMTPLSWTVLKLIYGQWVLHPEHDSVGNIGGRPYLNVSLFASVLKALGRSEQDTREMLEGTLYMHLPDGFEIPTFPVEKRSLPALLFAVVGTRIREGRGARGLPAYLASNPARCSRLSRQIQQSGDAHALLNLWREQILPHVTGSVWYVMGSVNASTQQTMRLRRTLEGLVGEDDAHALISSLSDCSGLSSGDGSGPEDGSGLLASLGPVVGMARLARGGIEPDVYLEQYGHRGPHEFELSVPRPAENPDWLERELARFRSSPVDVEAMLAQQREAFASAWARFEVRHPARAGTIRRQIDNAAHWARMRELARSEYVRDRWLIRAFALRAGELTSLGDGVFFLALDELLKLLEGDGTAASSIPAQQEWYQRYKALPAYPSMIVGHFDPFEWAADPGQRTDLFDARADLGKMGSGARGSDLIAGSPGSAGQVEGRVRQLDSPEDYDQLQAGEVLVTRQTDIAWTLAFPRAAAVVTDVGAPLSHAAIVAREMGIPAVVGCGDATMRLRTGDRVRVNGGQGTVEILEKEVEAMV